MGFFCFCFSRGSVKTLQSLSFLLFYAWALTTFKCSRSRVKFSTSFSFSLQASFVISTIPPALLGRISFNPPLPALKNQVRS